MWFSWPKRILLRKGLNEDSPATSLGLKMLPQLKGGFSILYLHNKTSLQTSQ